MKKIFRNSISVVIIGVFAAGNFGCSLSKNVTPLTSSSAVLTNAAIAGTGSVSVPTADAVVGRILMGFNGNVSLTSTNFSNALAKIQSNLPTNVNPLQASGLDQIPLLIYAACSDAQASAYNVTTSKSVTMMKANLVAAGVQMLDRYVGGMASAGAASSQVAAVFSSLVDQDSAAGASTGTTFISVCMAAHSYGVAMQGF